MRVVGLEEERLTRGQDTELAGATGLPEIYLCHPWPVREEPIPVVIRHSHVGPHRAIVARPSQLSGEPAIAPSPATIAAQQRPSQPFGKAAEGGELGAISQR